MKKGTTPIEIMILLATVGVIFMAIFSASKNSGEIKSGVKTEMVLPEATGYVVDESGILKPGTKTIIEEQLKALDSVAQVAVVTVKTTQPLDEKQYAIKLAEKWKVGYEGKDNGIIFLIVTEDRKVRIEVGRGLEGVINDAKAGKILDTAVVAFLKKNDWEGGILSGVTAISQEVNK